ncbi:MAG: preprotein translocase subunit SecE [Solirubrobacteraceae bacterium]|jgi:preprotein translocase SecE subunit|nr:preprotein translocase subunit SecE [Solirubrobacteraceae bacterium]
MARDRKRAKQRQRRRAEQQQPQEPPRPEPDEIAHDAREDDPNAAPDPLAHASADADIARMAEASAQEPGAPEGPLEPDEYPQPDELEGADVLGTRDEAPVRGSRSAAPEPRRDGTRLGNFLRACVAELRRVQWPDRRQVGQATGVVLGFVVIAGGYLGLLDAVFSRLVNAIL